MTLPGVSDIIRQVARALYQTCMEELPDGVPEGILYAACMERGMSYGTFMKFMEAMEKSGLVRRSGNLVYAIPPSEARS